VRSGALAVAAFLATFLFAACSDCNGTCFPPQASGAGPAASTDVATPKPVELQILGAASLKGALDKAKTAYEAARPGTTITISTDSSAALETQIEQGAPADVFLSADTTNPQKLVDGGFASGAPVVFAKNLLTIIVPTGNPARINAPMDIGKAGVRIIAAGAEVPITKYATKLVANIAATTADATAFEAAYARNIVTNAENVKSIVAQIELGQGDAAIVYVTDAKASHKVQTINVPDDVNVPASYAGVVVKDSANAAAATAFLEWLASPDGQAILASLGFLPPSP
jgi:molybdate transport system substrate-binding protein